MDTVPIPPRPTRPESSTAESLPFDPADYRKRLSEEYKILQDKIDKIGAFRFTIKGWAIAIVGAVLAAGSAVNGPVTTVVITFALAGMVVFFFELEVEQLVLSRLYGARAKALEKLFTSIDRGQRIDPLPPVPYIAHAIVKASYQREIASANRLRIDRWRTRLKDLWRIGRFAHRPFYIVLIFLTFLPTLRHGDEICKGISRANQWVQSSVRGVISQFQGAK